MTPPSLSTEERALAEKLARSAPRAEPSAALDARILAQARQSVRPPARRRFGPGFGIAAAALLAVGLAWHMGVFQTPDLVLESAPKSPTTSRFSKPAADAAPPGDTPATADEARYKAEESAVPAAPKMLPHAPAAPAPAPIEPAQPEPAPAAPPAAPPADGQPLPASALHTLPTDTPPAPASASEPPVRTPQTRLESDSDVAQETPASPPRVSRRESSPIDVSLDAKLPTAQWLERIRSHLKHGRDQAARDSLRLFVAQHPAHPLPDDLAELLRQ